MEEKELIYEKKYRCYVCDNTFSAKIVRPGRARMVGMDFDLRPRYEGIDPVKYEVLVCPKCGYAAMLNYFDSIVPSQMRAVREQISDSFQMSDQSGEIYTYEQAMERYVLAMASAEVRKVKHSEKAYISLKMAWLMRGRKEFLLEKGEEEAGSVVCQKLERREESYLRSAYDHFVEAVSSEKYPMCGMEEMTLNYLLAQLAVRFKDFDYAYKMLEYILESHSASERVKEKARVLKDMVLAAKQESNQ